ncbi:MAG: sigma-70 family RNA polymerase sigma factor [Planctomycetota bacterium]
MTDGAFPPSELLRHANWVAQLARALARDEHDAADLEQATWAAVLARPPAHPGNVRGFLGAVLRNVWRQDRRQDRRDAARRRVLGAALEPETAASTTDVVERAAAQRRVVDQVLALDEPYRSTVLLRFFDGHTVPCIAERQGVPAATVRTRLQRALQQLRLRLCAGGRGRGLGAALAPLLVPTPTVSPWSLLPVLAMKTKLALGLGAAAVAVGLWIATSSGPEASPTAPALAADNGVAPAPRSDSVAAPAPEPGAGRTLAATPAPAPAAAGRDAVPAAVTVRGEVRSSEDRPLPELTLRGRGRGGEVATARSDRFGAFAIELRADGEIAVDDAGWTTVLQAVVSVAAPPRSALVVAARAVRVGGVVVDEAGAPVAEAGVEVVLPEGFRARFTANADAASARAFGARSDLAGRFALDEAPVVEGALLQVAHPSFEPAQLPLPRADDGALRVVLRRPAAADDVVRGQVVTADGAPAANAWVALGERSVRADDAGGFALEGRDQGELLAVVPGNSPARVARPTTGWPAFVLVRLPAAPQTIRGRVLDGAGEPVANARVWATDPTPFGPADGDRVVAEGLALGGLTRGDLRELMRDGGAAVDPGELLRTRPLAIWPWARCAADGSFVLTGLLDRTYDLRAMNDDTLLQADLPGVRAGAVDVEIRLPRDGVFAELRGRVVGRDGAPVANVRVVPMCDAIRVQGSTIHAQAAATRTDADGRFHLREVPRQAAYLRLDGESILPLEYGRGHAGGLDDLLAGAGAAVVVEVRLRMHVQVEWADAGVEGSLRVLDADGEAVPIDVFEGRGRRTTQSLAFADGRTPVFVVPDTAVTLVLLQGEHEVRREPLVLVAGDVNRLRY